MKARTRKSFQSIPETLEVRQMLTPASFFVLDYTPDYRTMGSLHQTFNNVKFANGSVPRMFDFDGNGQLTGNDVTVAANEITSRVRRHFATYLAAGKLTIIAGDVNAGANQLLGDQWLRHGLKSNAVTVSVMFFGGRSAGGEYGRAPLALNGYNVEGFGEVYVRSIAIDLVNRNPLATPAEFAISVATTTAHELGHMMGLRHATSGPARNIMVPGRGRADNYFPNQAVSTENGRAQNPHHELWYSFQGQPSYYQVVSYGLPDPAMDFTHEHEHEHEHEHSPSLREEHLRHDAMMLDDDASEGYEALPFVQEPDPAALTTVDSYFARYHSDTSTRDGGLESLWETTTSFSGHRTNSGELFPDIQPELKMSTGMTELTSECTQTTDSASFSEAADRTAGLRSMSRWSISGWLLRSMQRRAASALIEGTMTPTGDGEESLVCTKMASDLSEQPEQRPTEPQQCQQERRNAGPAEQE